MHEGERFERRRESRSVCWGQNRISRHKAEGGERTPNGVEGLENWNAGETGVEMKGGLLFSAIFGVKSHLFSFLPIALNRLPSHDSKMAKEADRFRNMTVWD